MESTSILMNERITEFFNNHKIDIVCQGFIVSYKSEAQETSIGALYLNMGVIFISCELRKFLSLICAFCDFLICIMGEYFTLLQRVTVNLKFLKIYEV